MTHQREQRAGNAGAAMRRTLGSPIRVGVALLCTALALAGAIAPPAAAQSLNIDVGVDLPDWIRLFYWDTIPLAIDAGDLVSTYFGSPAINAGTRGLTMNMQGGAFTGDATIGNVVDDDLIADPGSDFEWFPIQYAWALQAVSQSGQTQVSIRVRNRNANAGGGARIRARDAMVGIGGAIARTISIQHSGYFLTWGDAYLQLDLSRASRAGTYNGIRVEITAENI
ncbi:MAG: hypothetical protein GKS06_15085 [Acidobacteria bacterium]|nr:hypothetical protein [Acidobacteriota bacterium]